MKELSLIVREFLLKSGYFKEPLLLALSGGPDSMALFHILLRLHCSFEVAHVDHGWRASSKKEAEELRALCAQHTISFHVTTLSVDLKRANLEEYCRDKRRAFFTKVLAERNISALLTGHHADDQAETVLKRALEGASLAKLSALLPVHKRGGYLLLRPLLKVPKEQILAYLAQNKISYFIDSTNEEERFLRVRMRKTIIPNLSTTFGKNVQKGLCRLAEHALEFTRYLDEICDPLLSSIEEVNGGKRLIFPKEIVCSAYLLKVALKRFFLHEGVCATNALLDIYVSHIQNLHKTKVEVVQGRTIELEGPIVTIFCKRDSLLLKGNEK